MYLYTTYIQAYTHDACALFQGYIKSATTLSDGVKGCRARTETPRPLGCWKSRKFNPLAITGST